MAETRRKAESLNWGSWAVRGAMLVVAVAVIVFFLPRTSGLKFRYDVGKPWMYSSLIAKFDFPIYKTDAAVKAEQDSAMAQLEPYYRMDEAVAEAQVARFVNDYKNGVPGLSRSYVATIANALRTIYQTGVLSPTDYASLTRDTALTIRLVVGKSATSVHPQTLYSTPTAYEQLFANPQLAAQRTLIQKCNLNEYVHANVVYDEVRTTAEQQDVLSGIPLASGMVLSGQKIIDRGEIVDEQLYRVLGSFEKETQRRSASVSTIPSTIAGQVLFVGILIFLFSTYVRLFRRDYFDKPRSILMLYTMIVAFPIIVSLMITNNVLSVYVLPVTIVPIFVRVFMDSRTAFVTHVTMVLLCAAAVTYQYEFIIIQIVAGLVAIYSLRDLSQRGQLIRTAVLVTAAGCAVYLALQLIQANSFASMNHDLYKYLVVNGILLLFAYPLMLIVEKMFGFISNVTLIELSNTSKDLLRQLSEEAPGTFQHSVTVGNLAAAVADRIGAKAQLVRTGAMYHDIGKMRQPAYYTENQVGVNPLDNMSRIDAAQVVTSHVTEGLKLADKHNLPTVIKDFIKTHHGAGKARYFYISYKNEHPDEPVDESLFAYPGPNPQTREQAILMMADAVEAASRSLPEYTEESIAQLVGRLIDGQLAEGFFANCPITFHDIAVAKQVLTERLKAIYHTRTVYPELKK